MMSAIFNYYFVLLIFIWLNGFPNVEEWNGLENEAIFCSERYMANSSIGEIGNIFKRVDLDDGILSYDVYFVNMDCSSINFHHKNSSGKLIQNINSLKKYFVKDSMKLLFATNGGMFNADYTPTGLYIENGVIEYPLNLKSGGEEFTNFYDLPPNGIFYIQENEKYGIIEREQFSSIKNVKFATQSAPMLLKKGELNEQFRKESKSKYIRSGVGVVARDKIMKTYEMIFAISNHPITFYDFSRIFKYYGCEQALYLDGAISEMYIHDSRETNRKETFNDFASIISVSDKF